MYKIILSNGYTIEGLELNGNNFIYETEIDDNVFEGNLKTVTVINEDTEEEHLYEDMVLVTNRVVNGKSWFILAEKSEEQKLKERNEKTFTDLQLALTEVYEMIIGRNK